MQFWQVLTRLKICLKWIPPLTFPGFLKPLKPAGYLRKNSTIEVYILKHKASYFPLKGLPHWCLYFKAHDLTLNGISKILWTATTVLEQLSTRKIPPPTPKITLTRGLFSLRAVAWLSPSLKLTVTLTKIKFSFLLCNTLELCSSSLSKLKLLAFAESKCLYFCRATSYVIDFSRFSDFNNPGFFLRTRDAEPIASEPSLFPVSHGLTN